MQQWGKVHNFTTQLKRDEIIANIKDSIEPLSFIDTFQTLVDVGTGAGYPGILLALARPNSKCYLVESQIKRVAFLNFVKNYLKLDNVFILGKKIELCDNLEADLITSRAVTNTALLMELTKNIIKKSNSAYLFYKGSLYEDEIKIFKTRAFKVVPGKNNRNYLYVRNYNGY